MMICWISVVALVVTLGMFRTFIGSAFPPIMGLGFLVTKMVIRYVTRSLASVDFDARDAVAWFGVDMAVLSLSLWISLRLHARMQLGYEDTVYVYCVLGLVVVLAAGSYRGYLRRASQVCAGGRIAKVSHECLKLLWMFSGLVLGFSAFAATIGGL
jgi:hypothetical protein